MTRWRIPLGLYLIGMFKTTLEVTLILKIQDITFTGGIFDGFYNWQIYMAFLNIFVSISIIMIIFILTKKEQNDDLTYRHDMTFVKSIMKHLIIYLIGYLTVPIFLLVRYYISGETATEEFNNDVMSIYGLVNVETSLPFLINDQLRYFLMILAGGVSSSVLPMLIIITGNTIRPQFIPKHNDEALYPNV